LRAKSRWHEELDFIKILKTKILCSFTQVQPSKYQSQVEQLQPSIRSDKSVLLDVLKIGFREEIFCNPELLSLSMIFSQLKNGQYDDLLLKNATVDTGLVKKVETALLAAREFSKFPRIVLARDSEKRTDLTGGFEWCLVDHQIYTKPRAMSDDPLEKKTQSLLTRPLVGNQIGWNLHDGNGGPKNLRKDEFVSEFQSAAEMVLAITNQGRVFLYKAGDKTERNDMG
jgi:hypothetical protein